LSFSQLGIVDLPVRKRFPLISVTVLLRMKIPSCKLKMSRINKQKRIDVVETNLSVASLLGGALELHIHMITTKVSVLWIISRAVEYNARTGSEF
jgi:hypothetical protein